MTEEKTCWRYTRGGSWEAIPDPLGEWDFLTDEVLERAGFSRDGINLFTPPGDPTTPMSVRVYRSHAEAGGKWLVELDIRGTGDFIEVPGLPDLLELLALLAPIAQATGLADLAGPGTELVTDAVKRLEARKR